MNKKENKIKKEKITSFREIIISFAIASVIGIVYLIFSWNFISSLIVFALFFVAVEIYLVIRIRLTKRARIRQMELVFPDFIELMASNLRAGMTIDKALLLSSRKEFNPLDQEILLLGKDILTGKEITRALRDLSYRIKSEKVDKTLDVIITGIRSGGNLAVLLEETALNMRERLFIEKRAASNVLMYLIFIFFAVAVGAPTLFALSATLVQVFSSIIGDLPAIETSIVVPISLTSISIPMSFIKYFSIIFLIAIDILASMLLGLVNKGEEREGIKYLIPLIAASLGIYFAVRAILSNYFADIAQ